MSLLVPPRQVPPRGPWQGRAAVSLRVPSAPPPTEAFSPTDAEQQVSALLCGSLDINRLEEDTVNTLRHNLVNYCTQLQTNPARVVELMLQKEFCAIGRKDADAVLGTFLEACLFKALRTNYPPPVRGAAIPPARTSCDPPPSPIPPARTSR